MDRQPSRRHVGTTAAYGGEHRSTIPAHRKAADWLIKMGPGSDEAGGQIVAVGAPGQITENKDSITGNYLQDILPKK